MKDACLQPQLPLFSHGSTNMESGIISFYESDWSITRISRFFKVPKERVITILKHFGFYKEPEAT